MNVIEVNHVTKAFRLGEALSVWQLLGAKIGRASGRPVQERAPFKALDDVHFAVEEGEVLGIIGSNGAGKSTLLKLLSGITEPTTGTVSVRGTVAPLIEVGAGLISDLTGRENVFLNGAILGMSRAQIRAKFDEIIGFAELEKFVDTPVKQYSSGMVVRLGFSIATSIDADILIVDEVLAVGDLAFQRKCFDKMEDMIKRQGKTVLLVSHNIRQVERLCSRVILLDHGEIVKDGDPTRVCDLFYERSDQKIKLVSKQNKKVEWANTHTSDVVTVREISLLNSAMEMTEQLRYKEDIAVRVRFTAHKDVKSPVLGVGVHTPDMLYITTHNSDVQIRAERFAPGEYEAICKVRKCPLLPGVYALRVGISGGLTSETLFYGENLVHFQVANPDPPLIEANRHGFFEMDALWESRLVDDRPSAVPTLATTAR